ncbi:glutaredoxin family protein [Candidatus Sororendozoicomonas aggregata]|uniref:glutaredoxin family protein n=1 Tax=Candidatus Sororendozoicomonas aggregata TaxID=3073239 RepID=UPI002ED55164
MKKLYFYTTTCCHLCEQAENLLRSLAGVVSFECEMIDIAESDQLVAQYGTKIPVLKNSKTGSEKCWPFTAEQLVQWIR